MLSRSAPDGRPPPRPALSGVATGAVVHDADAAVDALRAAREAGASHLELLIESGGGVDRDEAARNALEDPPGGRSGTPSHRCRGGLLTHRLMRCVRL